MDGNKIIRIILTGIITLFITACKVQEPSYVSLYVDNVSNIANPIDLVDPIMDRVKDTTSVYLTDTSIVDEQKMLVHKQAVEEPLVISSDSNFQYEIKKMLLAITDSIQQLNKQIFVLQNASKSDTVLRVNKIYNKQISDSIYSDFDCEKLLQSNNDIIALLNLQMAELKKNANQKVDTIYINNERNSLSNDTKTSPLLRSKNDSIYLLRNQLLELKNKDSQKTEIVYVFKDPEKTSDKQNQGSETTIQKLLQVKDDTIQLLQSQLLHIQLHQSQKDSILFLQSQLQNQKLQQAQKDSIQLLQSRLQKFQLQNPQIDTVYIEKEFKELQASKNLLIKQKDADYQVLQDSLALYKSRLLNLEKEIQSGMDTMALLRMKEKKVLKTVPTDTSLLVAFYGLGSIKPLYEDSLINMLKQSIKDDQISKITISGYTDTSGSEKINKEITNKRINYMMEILSQWIAIENIYVQNFGKTFSSDVKDSEQQRRLELKIFIK